MVVNPAPEQAGTTLSMKLAGAKADGSVPDAIAIEWTGSNATYCIAG